MIALLVKYGLPLVLRAGLPGLIVAGGLLFYEGVPLVGSIPFIDRIPGIGDIAVGRVGRERLQGALQERLVWQERDRRTRLKQSAQRRETQGRIFALETEFHESRLRLALLQHDINKGITDADYLCSGPAISSRLSTRLDAIGRD